MMLSEDSIQNVITNLLLSKNKVDFLEKVKDKFTDSEKYFVISKLAEVYNDYKSLTANSDESKINLLIEGLAEEIKNNHNLLLDLLKSTDDTLFELSAQKNGIKKEILDLLSIEAQSTDFAIKVDSFLDDYKLVLNELSQKKFLDDDVSPKRFAKIKRIYEKIFSMIDETVRIIFFESNGLGLYNKYSLIDSIIEEMRILRELIYKVIEKVELITTITEKEKELEEKYEEKETSKIGEFSIQQEIHQIQNTLEQQNVIVKEQDFYQQNINQEGTVQSETVQQDVHKEEIVGYESVEQQTGLALEKEFVDQEAIEGYNIETIQGTIQSETVQQDAYQNEIYETIEQKREMELIIEEGFTNQETIEEYSVEQKTTQNIDFQTEIVQKEFIDHNIQRETVIEESNTEQIVINQEIAEHQFNQTDAFKGEIIQQDFAITDDQQKIIDQQIFSENLPEVASVSEDIVQPVGQEQKGISILDISDLLSEFEKVEIEQDTDNLDSEVIFDTGELRIEKIEIQNVFLESFEQTTDSDTKVFNEVIEEGPDLKETSESQESIIGFEENLIPQEFNSTTFEQSGILVHEKDIGDVLGELEFEQEQTHFEQEKAYNQYEYEVEKVSQETILKDITSSIELAIPDDQQLIKVSQIDELAAILEEHQKDIQTAPIDIDLGDIDLSSIDLSDIDLSEIDLSGIDLSNVELDLSGYSDDLAEKDEKTSITSDTSELEKHTINFVYNKELDVKIQEVEKIFANQDIQKIIYLKNNEYSYYSKDKTVDNNELVLLKNVENISFSNLYFERGKNFGFLLKSSGEMLLIIFGEGVQVGPVKLKIKNITLGG
ncbi:MAG: hypothetical protein RMJ51_05040 [Candidatus Calescibacterium sp.]|nr:hypothetical protein [Candidatus Calescibacterium sp.]MCX7972522.1 hypothetical protein [bacterium]MDW8195585.1 hypothetical protein [Candidatus Calescibacterium sp.]